MTPCTLDCITVHVVMSSCVKIILKLTAHCITRDKSSGSVVFRYRIIDTRNKVVVIMNDSKIFDVDLADYASKYHGNTLYARLIFIAKQFPSLSVQAYSLLSTAIKSGRNSKLYCDIFSNKSIAFGTDFDFDKEWVDETERKNHMHLERLEADFSAAKSSMIKEAVRVAYNDLGRHYSDVGNLQEALRTFTRTRDYTSTPRHAEEMVLSVCTLAIDLQRPHLLLNFLGKNMEEGASSPVVRDKLRALSAIQHLSIGDLAEASRRFASVESSIVDSFGSVLSAEDVALGAVMCGMAALQRGELQALLLENPRFKPLLDFSPSLRQLLGHFLAGRCVEAKMALEGLRQRVCLDLHLHPQAARLLGAINDNLVLQYFRPYSCIRLARAADDLFLEAATTEERKSQEEELEAHLRRLIEGGGLRARLDAGCAEGATLRRVWPDERALALQAVCAAAADSSPKLRRAVLRLSLLKNGFSITAARQHRGMGGDALWESAHEGGGPSVMEFDPE